MESGGQGANGEFSPLGAAVPNSAGAGFSRFSTGLGIDLQPPRVNARAAAKRIRHRVMFVPLMPEGGGRSPGVKGPAAAIINPGSVSPTGQK